MDWTLLLCGLPSLLVLLAGLLAAGLGALANARQLKLDTNLERRQVIRVGLAAAAAGVILIAITLAIR